MNEIATITSIMSSRSSIEDNLNLLSNLIENHLRQQGHNVRIVGGEVKSLIILMETNSRTLNQSAANSLVNYLGRRVGFTMQSRGFDIEIAI
jgi:hypothetical protein